MNSVNFYNITILTTHLNSEFLKLPEDLIILKENKLLLLKITHSPAGGNPESTVLMCVKQPAVYSMTIFLLWHAV